MRSLPHSHRYFIVVHDLYSKWPEVLPTSTITSSTCITALNNLFSRWGLPEQVTTDNGRQFISSEFEDFLQSQGIRHKTTALYCPEQNGGVERFNAVIKNGLRTHMADGKDVNEAIRQTLLAYRSSAHVTTGTSPAERMLGRRLRMPLHRLVPSLSPASEREKTKQTHASQQQGRKAYDFAIGSYVRVKRPRLAKTDRTISEPLRVVSRCGNTYTLEDGSKWHASRCTPVQTPTLSQTLPDDAIEATEQLADSSASLAYSPPQRHLPERSRHPPQFFGDLVVQ